MMHVERLILCSQRRDYEKLVKTLMLRGVFHRKAWERMIQGAEDVCHANDNDDLAYRPRTRTAADLAGLVFTLDHYPIASST